MREEDGEGRGIKRSFGCSVSICQRVLAGLGRRKGGSGEEQDRHTPGKIGWSGSGGRKDREDRRRMGWRGGVNDRTAGPLLKGIRKQHPHMSLL